MFSNILFKIQNKSKYLYENSLFLQNTDAIILVSILAVIILSTFVQSDCIGFVALITMFFTFIKLITKCGEKLEFNKFELFLLAYFMIVVISLMGSTLFSLSLKGFFKTFVYIGFYFSLANYLKNNLNKIPLIIGTIAVCISYESIIALMQNFARIEAISTWQDTTNLNAEQIMTRVYGTLKPYNPNLFGGYLIVGVMSVIGSFVFCLYKKYFKCGILAGLFSLLSVIAIFLTGCRGAYIALLFILGAVFFVFAKFFWQKYKKVYLSVITGVISFFILALTVFTSLRSRFLSIFAMRNDSSNSFRFNVYQSSLEMFKDNWLLGIGVGNKNFREIYGLYMKTGFDALSAYNIFLETAVESGIFALIAFLGFVILYIKYSLNIIFKSTDIEKIIFTSVAAISVTAVLLHGFVDTVFFRPQIQFIFWIMVAIVSAYKFNKENI